MSWASSCCNHSLVAPLPTHYPGREKWPAWASQSPLLGPLSTANCFSVSKALRVARSPLTWPPLIYFYQPHNLIWQMSPGNRLFALNNICFLRQSGQIETVRDVIFLYQSGTLGYAVVTNDPQISVAYKLLYFLFIVSPCGLASALYHVIFTPEPRLVGQPLWRALSLWQANETWQNTSSCLKLLSPLHQQSHSH